MSATTSVDHVDESTVNPITLSQWMSGQAVTDTTAMPWYAVLARFKLGIPLEGSHARYRAGKAPESVGQLVGAAAIELFERARTFTAAGI